MITIRRGDMFAEEVDALVNPVNCVGVMGAGVALEFKKRWPAYEANYANDCEMGRMSLTQPMLWPDRWPSGRPVKLISFPTKQHWREKSRLREIELGLRNLATILKAHEFDIRSVAIPALGCGLGGLAWNDVKDLMFQMLVCYVPDTDIRLYEPMT